MLPKKPNAMANFNARKKITQQKPDFSKIVLTAVLICVVTAVMLYFYVKTVPELIQKLEDLDATMEHMIWFVDNLTLFFPMLVPILVLAAVYSNKQAYRPIYSQKEQFWICLVTMIFTYLVMMPYVLLMSRETVDLDGKEIETLWDITYRWFFMQVIPLVLMTSYHAVRAESEAREPEAPKETVAPVASEDLTEAPAEEDPA